MMEILSEIYKLVCITVPAVLSCMILTDEQSSSNTCTSDWPSFCKCVEELSKWLRSGPSKSKYPLNRRNVDSFSSSTERNSRKTYVIFMLQGCDL